MLLIPLIKSVRTSHGAPSTAPSAAVVSERNTAVCSMKPGDDETPFGTGLLRFEKKTRQTGRSEKLYQNTHKGKNGSDQADLRVHTGHWEQRPLG